MACCKKPAAKQVAVKDLGTKKNPKGGMTKQERPIQIAAPQIEATMSAAVSAKLGK